MNPTDYRLMRDCIRHIDAITAYSKKTSRGVKYMSPMRRINTLDNIRIQLEVLLNQLETSGALNDEVKL